MNLRTRSKDAPQVQRFGSPGLNLGNDDQKPPRSFPTSETCEQAITWSISITASPGSEVCKHLILVHGPVSSCCCFMQRNQSCLCRSKEWTWSNVTRAPKVINRNSTALVALVGKRQKQKRNAPCATWLTSFCVCMLKENSSEVSPSLLILHGRKSLRMVFPSC